MYVQDNSSFTVGVNVIVGGAGAYKTVAALNTDTVYGDFISGEMTYPSTLGSGYPALPGCFVYRLYPLTGSYPANNSPSKVNGLIAVTDTVDQAITRGDLEVYATQALINHSFYLRKGSFTCLVTDFLKPGDRGINQVYDWMMIREGDRIAVCPTEDNAPNLGTDKFYDGQYKFQWEVVTWTLDCNAMQLSVEIGDYEPTVFSLITDKTAALDKTIS